MLSWSALGMTLLASMIYTNCPNCQYVSKRETIDVNKIDKPFLGTSANPEAFEALTKTPVRVKVIFNGKNKGWDVIEGKGKWVEYAAQHEKNPNLMILLSYSLIPTSEGKSEDNLPKCARGDYNHHYREFAANMKKAGIKSMIIRPGWEFTLDSWPWGTNNNVNLGKLYASCFRNFVSTVDRHYASNKFLYEWNVQQDATPASMDAAWPGSRFVDIVGVDLYDTYFQKKPKCRTSEDCRWKDRTLPVIIRVRNFAKSKSKPIGVSEWGIWTGLTDGRGAGDNPTFVTNVCNFAKNRFNHVFYYAYFDEVNDIAEHRLNRPGHRKSLEAFQNNCIGNRADPHKELSVKK